MSCHDYTLTFKERRSTCDPSLQHHQRHCRYDLDRFHGLGYLLLQLLAHWLSSHQFVSRLHAWSDDRYLLRPSTGTEHLTDSVKPTTFSTSQMTGVSSIRRCTRPIAPPTCRLVTSPSTSGSLPPMPLWSLTLSCTTETRCKTPSSMRLKLRAEADCF